MRLGVCYYPEHWPETWWADDARRMAEMGLTRVRIGEFAWSRIEPEPGRFAWEWLDRAIATLHEAGLGIILGTPTATPPKWLVDRMPDMVALDEEGRPRRFGSRRHYCFSHPGYAAEAARIVAAIAQRYGRHPAIVAWQTDNEYGCHDTAISYSDAALSGFRNWLKQRYADIEALNAAWGNVFWSMEYASFDAVDLPNLAVTEANPAHWLAFRRYSSDQVARFNRMQCQILRDASPGRDIFHNFMGFFTQFDHHAVARDLDIAGWDSYPLGFLEQFWFSDDDKRDFARQGHPDIAAFHHDLYRGCTPSRRWAVLEQQPGPVNWARHNPAPLPGMVRLWTLEACAHGAELVSYFRWRQAPFGQEQMHAGLLRPDRCDDVAAAEVRQAAREIGELGPLAVSRAPVAVLFDYESCWVTDIQPQGSGQGALKAALDWYSSLRRLGFDIDIISPAASLDGYRLVVVPCLPILPPGLVERLRCFAGQVIVGPRSGSKTSEFRIPHPLPPGELQSLIPLKVTRVESLRKGLSESGPGFSAGGWLEHVETALSSSLALDTGRGVGWTSGGLHYLATALDEAGRIAFFGSVARRAGLAPMLLPPALRTRTAGGLRFFFNYGREALALPQGEGPDVTCGSDPLPAAGVAIVECGRPKEAS
jgi:beta-galactosidase